MSSRTAVRWRTGRWVVLVVVVLAVLAAVSTYFTSPRDGGRLDANSTSPDGAHAIVALLRDQGVEVEIAETVADVERQARPDTLLVIAQTHLVVDETLLGRLAAVPGDRLLLEPVSATREALAPKIRTDDTGSMGGPPRCDLPEAERAGTVYFGYADTFAALDDHPLVGCYRGAVVRYEDDGRTVTVVGSASFMTNSALLTEGNAALAMNLAGQHERLIWYVPPRLEGERTGGAELTDLVPDNVTWAVFQFIVVVLLCAIWQGRRLGPLVAERLPVVVRASETVEGRGRLYRSHRARDRAADALRTATLQRMTPRLGLSAQAAPADVVAAVAGRCDRPPESVGHLLYGPSPDTDDDLTSLARELDNIERQVTKS